MSATTHPQTNSQTEAGVPPAPPEPHPQAVGNALRAQEGEGTDLYIPLRSLRLDERNVRSEEPAAGEIEELADLIAAQSLLQGLQVVAYEHPVREGKGRNVRMVTHGVVAGGRRYRALHLLVKRRTITLDYEVLCREVPEERAVAVSVAENSGRKAMSDAERIEAFAKLAQGGAGVDELSAAFGLSVGTVQRRLRLARVSPVLMAEFRSGAMSLDQLMALALTDDHERQESVWRNAPEYRRHPQSLRAMIAGEQLPTCVVQFVGLQAYEAAGGRVLRDLFSDDEDAYIVDPEIMVRLGEAKLQDLAEQVRAEGVAWVDVYLGHVPYDAYRPAPHSLREPTPDEAARLQAIAVELGDLDRQIEAIEDADGEGEGEGEGLYDRRYDLEAEHEAINLGRCVPAPGCADLVGVVISLDTRGAVVIARSRVRKADAQALERRNLAGRAAGTGDGAHDGGDEQPARPAGKALSERLCLQLTAHRTRALQAEILGMQGVALACLAYPLVLDLLGETGDAYLQRRAVNARAQDCESRLREVAPDLAGSPADAVMTEAIAQAREMLPEDAATLLPWLIEQPTETVLQLLTLCSALSFNAMSANGEAPHVAPIAKAVALDMRRWWTATPDSYLGLVSKAQLAEAVAEAGMSEQAKDLGKLKKGDAVTKAAELLAGKGWLPTVLR